MQRSVGWLTTVKRWLVDVTDRILVFGASGQLGSAVLATAPSTALEAPRTVDVADSQDVLECVRKAVPDWVVNCAAMTDVDGAHQDPQRAFAVNALGPGNLARAAEDVGARVIQISTEAVFSGAAVVAYTEEDVCQPVSVYGSSKLSGESLVSIYCPGSYVLRTSWLYSDQRGTNFPTRVLNQLEDPGKKLSVVTDIVGNPTPTSLLADAISAILRSPPDPGVYHVCAGGPASKFDWAVEIAIWAGFDPGRISPVSSDAYPTVARRPKYVDLDCSKFQSTSLLELPTWRDAWLSEISAWDRRPGALDSSSANA